MQPAPNRHLSYIEGMRGLAALYVVLGHFCTMVDPAQRIAKSSSLAGLISRQFWFGHLAVAAFIVISGFCLQLALFNRGGRGTVIHLKSFFVRRCRRILPPYYACLILSLVVCWTVTRYQTGMPWSQYVPLTTPNVAAHFTMIHNLSPEWMYKINGVLWSIAIEFQLYFLFPAIAAIAARRARWPVLFTVGFAVAGLGLAVPAAHKSYFWFLWLFWIGAMAAREAFAGEDDGKGRWAGWLALGSVLAVVAWTAIDRSTMASDLALGYGIAVLLMVLAKRPQNLVTRILGSRLLAGLGAFSYSLYLIHHPLLQVLYVNRPAWASTPVRQWAYLLAIGIPVILFLSWIFYRVFERPFMSKPAARRPVPVATEAPVLVTEP